MNGSLGGLFGPDEEDDSRKNRLDMSGDTGFVGPVAQPPKLPFTPPDPGPLPGPGRGSKSPKSSPDPVPLPTPVPEPVAPAPITAEDLPADAGLVTQLQQAIEGFDLPAWATALSPPYDEANQGDVDRMQDLIVGNETETGRAVEVYRKNNENPRNGRKDLR